MIHGSRRSTKAARATTRAVRLSSSRGVDSAISSRAPSRPASSDSTHRIQWRTSPRGCCSRGLSAGTRATRMTRSTGRMMKPISAVDGVRIIELQYCSNEHVSWPPVSKSLRCATCRRGDASAVSVTAATEPVRIPSRQRGPHVFRLWHIGRELCECEACWWTPTRFFTLMRHAGSTQSSVRARAVGTRLPPAPSRTCVAGRVGRVSAAAGRARRSARRRPRRGRRGAATPS